MSDRIREALEALATKTDELIAHLKATGRLRDCFNLPALEVARAALAEPAAEPAAEAVAWPSRAELEVAAIKAERRALMYGDLLHNHILAMRAALVDSAQKGPDAGIQWIINTLEGPGHLPDDADIAMGAQALFDKETAEHEAFRAAHPAPTLPTNPPAAPSEARAGLSESQVAEIKRLAREVSNATFDCGAWEDDAAETYTELCGRADAARTALHAYLDTLITPERKENADGR